VLFLADEVITGFGRTGKMFGLWQWEGVQPDLMSFAKGVTSGYQPLGGVQISEDESWMHGFTYSGHPTACAVATENINIIENEGLVENAKQMGERLLDGLQGLTEFAYVDNARGMGLLCGIEIVKDKESREPDLVKAAQVMDMAQERGVRTRVLGNTLALSPGLCINEDEVDIIIQTLGAVFDTI